MALTRITVNLNERSLVDLTRTAILEERNRSTVINRAIQVYARLIELQHAGGAVVLEFPDAPSQRVLFT